MTSTPRKFERWTVRVSYARGVIVKGTILEVANVLECQHIVLAKHSRQHRHVGMPVAVVARFLPQPPDEEQPRGADQHSKRLPERLPEHEHRTDADGPACREQPPPP